MRRIVPLAFVVFLAATWGRSSGAGEEPKWEQVGKKGDWKDSACVVAMHGHLWTLESDGTLYRTDASGKKVQVGQKGARPGAKLMVVSKDLWVIDTDGTLWKLSLDWQAEAR